MLLGVPWVLPCQPVIVSTSSLGSYCPCWASSFTIRLSSWRPTPWLSLSSWKGILFTGTAMARKQQASKFCTFCILLWWRLWGMCNNWLESSPYNQQEANNEDERSHDDVNRDEAHSRQVHILLLIALDILRPAPFCRFIPVYIMLAWLLQPDMLSLGSDYPKRLQIPPDVSLSPGQYPSFR